MNTLVPRRPGHCAGEVIAREWRPIESAPKDGTVVELTAIDADGELFEVWPMGWAHIQQNGMFPGKVGMWTHPSGQFTWNDDGDGGPTHWRPLERTLSSAEPLAGDKSRDEP